MSHVCFPPSTWATMISFWTTRNYWWNILSTKSIFFNNWTFCHHEKISLLFKFSKFKCSCPDKDHAPFNSSIQLSEIQPFLMNKWWVKSNALIKYSWLVTLAPSSLSLSWSLSYLFLSFDFGIKILKLSFRLTKF